MLLYWAEKDKNKIENLLGIGLMLGLFLPHTNALFLMVNPVLCLFYKFYLKGNYVRFNVKHLMVMSLLLTLFINIFAIQTLKPFLGFANIFLLFMLFPIIGDVRVKNVFLYLSLTIIIVSQFAYLFNISILVNTLDKVYPVEGMFEGEMEYMKKNITMDTLTNYRLGGLFRNSNLCSTYVSFVLCVFLLENKDEKFKKKLLFIILALISILLCGSRSGVAVSIIMLGYLALTSDHVKKEYKYASVVLFIVIFIAILVNGSEKFRALNISQGFENSANSKWYVLVDYLTYENSPTKLLFGYLDPDRFIPHSSVMKYFDSEYGNLIFCYGIFGVWNVIFFYYMLCRQFDNKLKMIFVILLWSISNAVLVSFRTSFLLMLFLSKYYTQSRSKSSNYNNKLVR